MTIDSDASDAYLSNSELEEDSSEELHSSRHSSSSGDREPDLLGDNSLSGNVETGISNDFTRLVDPVRNAPGAADAEKWQFDIQEYAGLDYEYELNSSRKRQGKRQQRGDAHLSEEVKALMGEASTAHVAHDWRKAIPLLRRVIQIEPNYPHAWNYLADCHEGLGDDEQALQLHIIGAHLIEPDSVVWRALALKSRQMGFLQQAAYCYRKVIVIDPQDVDALWDRSYLLREMGEVRNAMNGFLAILKIYPHAAEVLEQLRSILIELNDLPRAMMLYQDAFDHFRTLTPSGVIEDSPSSFGSRHIIALADFYNSLARYEDAILTIRAGARWLDGRSTERYWDALADDREFSTEGFSRQLPGDNASSEPLPGDHPLDPNMRHRLAIARLRLGHLAEGKLHCEIILGQDVLEYWALFTEIGDACFAHGLYEEALRAFVELGSREETTTLAILLRIATCHRQMGNLEEATQVYEIAISADEHNSDAKMGLAEIYEITNRPGEALELVNEGRRNRSLDNQSGSGSQPVPSSGSLLSESRRLSTKATPHKPISSLSAKELLELELKRQKEFDDGFKRVSELEEQEGSTVTSDWIQEAGRLVEGFRQAQILFPSDRFAYFRASHAERKDGQAADALLSRLQHEIAETSAVRKYKARADAKAGTFRGVSFERWLFLFIKYGFALAQTGEHILADEVLRHAILSSAYVDFSSQTRLRLALLSCATYRRDYVAVVEHSRRIIYTHQFNNDPIRLLLASLGGGGRATTVFTDNKLQKMIWREMKTLETVIAGQSLTWSSHSGRYTLPAATPKTSTDDPGDDDADAPDSQLSQSKATSLPQEITGNPHHSSPTMLNPIFFTVHGQTALCSRSYQTAIVYLLQAFNSVPDDPVVCLCLGVACIGRAMQRQSDNRHQLVAEAMAFMHKYRALRSPDHRGEVEFNFGRAFHHLGLLSLAVKHYESALEIPDADFNREAAYNLSIIYVTTGAPDLAKALYRRWLSV